ncbi:hypothetical protein D3C78_1162420 [compost metagenome]
MNKTAALGRLVTRVLNNINERRPNNWNFEADGSLEKEASIDNLMIWFDTNEGNEFWRVINDEGRLPKDFDAHPKKKPAKRGDGVDVVMAAINDPVPMPIGIAARFAALQDRPVDGAIIANDFVREAEQQVVAAPPKKRAKEPVKEPAKVLGWWGPVN